MKVYEKPVMEVIELEDSGIVTFGGFNLPSHGSETDSDASC